ncbi:MAG: hypothetical protein Q9217_005997, partial [Psora testacea]
MTPDSASRDTKGMIHTTQEVHRRGSLQGVQKPSLDEVLVIYHEHEALEDAVMAEDVTSGMTHLADRGAEVKIGTQEIDSILETEKPHRWDELDLDSREVPLPAGSDIFTSRGRGGFRGRGRADWEYNRGRSYQADDRAYDPPSHSRDRHWEQQVWDYNPESGKRDDNLRMERGDRDRDERSRSDQAPYRPDSRNSLGASRSTSTTSLQLANQDRTVPHSRSGQESALDYDRRSTAAGIAVERAIPIRDIDRPDPLHRRSEDDRYILRPSSPPPPPSVPAFGGSLMPPTTAIDQESLTEAALPKEEERLIHPSRRGLMEPSRDSPQPSPEPLNAPIAPKAQQRPTVDESLRPGSVVPPSNTTLRDAPLGSNWSKRFTHPNPAPAVTAPRTLNAEQPSVRRAPDEDRNSNVPSISGLRAPLSETSNPSNQTSPMKIPTGPRAGRAPPPSIRQPIQPSIRGPITRPPPMIPRAQRQASTWSWVRPGLPQAPPRGPSIMNKVPTKRDLDGGEEKSRPSPAPSAFSAVEKWRQKNILPMADSHKLIDEKASDDDQDEAEETANRDEASPHGSHGDLTTGEVRRDEPTNEVGNGHEIGMDLDDADFHNNQQKYNRDMRRLEAKRPPTPRSHPELLQMVVELDALAIAMRESEGGETGVVGVDTTQHPVGGLLSPKAEDAEMDVKSEGGSVARENESGLQTPPIESLPFLQAGPPTPFSDFGELKPDFDHDDAIRGLIFAKLSQDHEMAARAFHRAKQTFIEQFRPWRRGLDFLEDQSKIKEEEARTGLTPLETTPELASAPQTVRSRRVVSEYGLDAIMKESMETAAREERARREREEREAQVYVPVDTFNSEREAEIPDMLGPIQIRDMLFADKNNFVESDHVLDALRYVPPKDDFTKDEHKEFLYHYVMCPKRFGEIAEKLGRRDYKACVRHYYASKRSANYRNQEAKFYKTGRGKRFVAAADRAAGMRPRGGLLASSMDGAVDYEAQNAALTESGRPKRAAAPTFGESAEPEIAPPATTTPARRSMTKDGNSGVQSAERTKSGKAKATSTGLKPGRRPKIAKDQPQPILAAAPDVPQRLSPEMEAPNQTVRTFHETVVPEPPQPADEHEAAQLLVNLPTSLQTYPVPSYTEHWVSGQSTFTGSIQFQEKCMPRKHEQLLLPPQPRTQQVSDTTSYWSVPEKQDFRNYIKNYYQRETDPKKGEQGRALEEAAMSANRRRALNEDMGPLPPPAPIQPKRRYDSNSTREQQRPLAPSVDLTGVGDDSPSLRPTKTQKSPPSLSGVSTRLPTSSQAEQKAAAASAQMQAQGPQSPASRGVLHTSRGQQQIQGPHMGTFTDGRTALISQSRG